MAWRALLGLPQARTGYLPFKRTYAPLALALAVWCGSGYAEIDQADLGGFFGYAKGTPETSMQDKYIVITASNPESVYASKPVKRSGSVSELPKGPQLDPSRVTYTFRGKTYSLAEYLEKTRTTGMLIIQDGQVVFEKYQYQRAATSRLLSFSMSKSITALLIGLALEDGAIRSLDDKVQDYVPELRSSAYATVTIRQLLSMTSGVAWNDGIESGTSDMLELNECHMRHRGCSSSLALLAAKKTQQYAPGLKFNYSGGDTMVLGHILRATTRRDVTTYTRERLWSQLGAEDDAAWMVDRDGVENVFGHFAARMRDYGRLGLLLQNQGEASGKRVIGQGFWREMTSAQYPATKPKTATGYFGYPNSCFPFTFYISQVKGSKWQTTRSTIP